jgi:hypothetical protein
LDGTPATNNLYLIGNVQVDDAVLTRPTGYYKLYRQRSVNGTPTGEPKSFIVTDTVYDDVDIQPGGEYCYWTTWVSNGAESCSSDTSCVFILYQQTLQAEQSPLDKIYGDPAFKLSKSGTDGYYVRSTVDAIDYFAGRTVPVTMDVYDGDVTALTLTGTPSDYTATINTAGSLRVRARQFGIADTLLPAPAIAIRINIAKLEMFVKAVNAWRYYGETNPTLQLEYETFAYSDGVSKLNTPPQVNCYATPTSPVGDYVIVVTVFEDDSYILIPVNGVLTVKAYEGEVNAFTPYDLDGYNDTFMPGQKVKIYNRYGVLVYETRNAQQAQHGWNGRFQSNNRLVDPGVYYYVLYDDNGKVVRKGSVNVVKK